MTGKPVSREQAAKWNARVELALKSLGRLLEEYATYRPEEAENFDSDWYIAGFYSQIAAARAYLSEAEAVADE